MRVPRISHKHIILTIASFCFVRLLTDRVDTSSLPVRRLDVEDQYYTESLHRFGSHYLTLYVKNDRMRLEVSLEDDVTSFPCLDCEGCGDQHYRKHYFNYSQSDVHMCPGECVLDEARCMDGGDSKCIVRVDTALGESMYSGFEISDQVFVDSIHGLDKVYEDGVAEKFGFEMNMVCQAKVRGDLVSNLADGVVSLSTGKSSLLRQMAETGDIQHQIASLCFRPFTGPLKAGVGLGHVQLGSVDRESLTSPLVWAANIAQVGPSSHKNYALNLRHIYLGVGGGGPGEGLVRAATGTMSIESLTKSDKFDGMSGGMADMRLDTQSVETWLDAKLESAFVEIWASLSGDGAFFNPAGMMMSKDKFLSLPTLFFQFQASVDHQGVMASDAPIPGFAGRLDEEYPYDVLLEVPPQNYMVYDEDRGLALPTIYFREERFSVGASVLRGHQVVLDLDHDRIGFAQTDDCIEGLTLKPFPPMEALTASEANIPIIPWVPALKREKGKTPPAETFNQVEDGKTVFHMRKPSIIGFGTTVGEIDDFDATRRLEDGTSTESNSTEAAPEPTFTEEEAYDGLPQAEGYASYFRVGNSVATGIAGEGASVYGNGYWNLIGIGLMLLGFSFTAFATRDRTSSKKDKKHQAMDAPESYDDADAAWNSGWQQQESSDEFGQKVASNYDYEEASQSPSFQKQNQKRDKKRNSLFAAVDPKFAKHADRNPHYDVQDDRVDSQNESFQDEPSMSSMPMEDEASYYLNKPPPRLGGNDTISLATPHNDDAASYYQSKPSESSEPKMEAVQEENQSMYDEVSYYSYGTPSVQDVSDSQSYYKYDEGQEDEHSHVSMEEDASYFQGSRQGSVHEKMDKMIV